VQFPLPGFYWILEALDTGGAIGHAGAHGECRRSSHQLDSVEATARRKKCRLHGRLVQLSEK